MVFTVLHYIVFIRVNVSVNKRVVIVIILVMLSPVTYHLGVVKKRNPKMSSLYCSAHNKQCIHDAEPLDNLSNKEWLGQHCFT